MPLPANFPTSLDSLANPTATTNRDDPGFELDEVISRIHDILEAIEAKVGITASTPAAGQVFRGTGSGTSAWGQIAAGDIAPGTATLLKLDEQLGTGASGLLQFSSISGAYRNLIVTYVGRSDTAATLANVQLTFETSPTANAYNHQTLLGQAAATGAAENIGTSTFILAGFVAGASSTANVYGGARIYLPEYANTSIFKAVAVQTHGGTTLATGGIIAEIVSGVWESTAAIDRIRLTLSAGNWTTASRATLYGEPA